MGHSQPLRGEILGLSRTSIHGWAVDPDAPACPPQLVILVDGRPVDRPIALSARRWPGAEGYGFHLAFQPPLSFTPHDVTLYEEAQPVALFGTPRALPGLRGHIDALTRERVRGWAEDTGAPGQPVALVIRVDGVVVAAVTANAYRDDLERHGIGRGHQSFDLLFVPALSRLRHVVEIVRESDGAPLGTSPLALETPEHFDAALQDSIVAALDTAGTEAELKVRVAFLARQMVRLQQRLADATSRREARWALRRFRARWPGPDDPLRGDGPMRIGGGLAAPEAAGRRRALVIDSTMPDLRRDAGSAAVVSHAAALGRLGYAVTFAAADMSSGDEQGVALAALAALGIECCHAPWFGSVEEVLRAQAGAFDLVYLHRVENAVPYLALVRRHQPTARAVYSVADLHHLRLGRQAVVAADPAIRRLADRVRRQELAAAAGADVVITHSSVEAALLRQANPALRPHVVPWAIPARPGARRFAGRRGLAFVGHFGHTPNIDAASLLVHEIMPLVWARDPALSCHIAGGGLPAQFRQDWPGDRITVSSPVDDLAALLGGMRMTVAPLLYGAGVKGKVLDSLAAGVPCICTPTAAEGIALGPALAGLVAADPPGLADSIHRLHGDAALFAACRAEGLCLVRTTCSERQVDASLGAAVLVA